MGRLRWDRPDECDHVLLLAAPDGAARRALRDRLSRVVGVERRAAVGRYPRFRLVLAADAAQARRRATRDVTAAALDLALPGAPGLETLRELRAARPALAILAFRASPDASDAVAAVMSGADFFHERADGGKGIERAVELAIDRRKLTQDLERTEEAMERARGKLAELSGELVRAVPQGLKALRSREDVLPFREAARRYLLSSAQLFAADPRGLARALGVSYFALRRLLARYDVPFPAARPRR